MPGSMFSIGRKGFSSGGGAADALGDGRRNAARREKNDIGTRMESIGAFLHGDGSKELAYQRNSEKEKSSRAFFCPDHASMAFNDMFAYGKAQPC